jgi:hypothetical protein
MWADVYTKSLKMSSGGGGKIAKLKKYINVAAIFTGSIICFGFAFGVIVVATLWILINTLLLGGTYLWAGKKLADVLAPKDAKAAGAASAIAASNEIRRTSRIVAYFAFGFVVGLLGYSQTVEKLGQAAGMLSLSLVCFFLFCGLAMQARIVLYIRFGNRKKLNKAGFKDGMRR